MKKLFFIMAMLLSLSVFADNHEVKSGSVKELLMTADNTLALRDSFNESSVAKLMDQAAKLNSSLPSGYPIYLFLYTPGGSIQDGLELFEYLKGLNRPVHTVTLFAASMGFQTVQGLGNRYIMRYGVLMSHKARGGFTGEFGGGFSQLDSRYGMWLRRIDMMDKDTVAKTKGKQTLESYRAAYSNELWLNGQEAVEQGYADEVVTVKCDEALNSSTVTEEIDLFFFKVRAVFSACPVRTSPLAITVALATNKGELTLENFVQQGGKFGKECRTAETVTSSYYESEVQKLPSELCLVDNTITMEQIKKAIADRKAHYTRDLKSSIEYSY